MKKLKKNPNNVEWIHSACAMCIGALMKVKVRNSKIVGVVGEDIPGWDEKICGKAVSGLADRIYSPNRILYPLKRDGERGEGKFVRCSWEEVIDALTDKLKEYINIGHPEYFEIWWGCPDQQDKVPFLYYWSTVVNSGISCLHGQVCFGDHRRRSLIGVQLGRIEVSLRLWVEERKTCHPLKGSFKRKTPGGTLTTKGFTVLSCMERREQFLGLRETEGP